jgi:hypothetical protein
VVGAHVRIENQRGLHFYFFKGVFESFQNKHWAYEYITKEDKDAGSMQKRSEQ